MIVLKIENINRLFFCLLEAAFKIHLAQKSEGLNGHDDSGFNYIFSRNNEMFSC